MGESVRSWSVRGGGWSLLFVMVAVVLVPGVAVAAPRDHGKAPRDHGKGQRGTARVATMPIPVGYVGGWGAGLRVLDVPNRVVNATLATSQFAFQMVIAANTDATYLIDTTRVSKFDRSTNTITAQIAVPGAHLLVAGAVSPDGRWVYAVDRNGTKVFVVDTVAPNPVTSITVGGGLISAMLNADGSRLYVGSEWTNAIYVIDTATNTPTGDSPLVTTGANSEDLTLSPDGSKMLVSNTGAGVVSVIDTATNQVNVGAITGATQVYATVYSPDGSWIYAIGYDGTVRKYSAANYALDSSLAIGNLASGGAISPDGSTLFVTRFIGAGEVVPIDLTTSSPGVLGTAGTPITGFAYPRDIILADAVVPGAPTIGVVTTGDSQATVNFTAPTFNGGTAISSYQVVDAGHGVNFSCPGTTSPCVVTGLTNGTTYDLTIVATNAVGDSAASSAVSVTPATVPDAPAIADLRVRGAAAVVTFGAPVGTGGAAIVGYEYRTGNGAWRSLPTTGSGPYTGTITGLTPGASYTITLRAVNNAGGGPASAGATVLIPAVPGAPGGVSATAGAGRATVAFTAPGSDGGSAITTYTATARPGRATATCTASPCTVTGLDNGTSYTFTVRAANAIGDSAESVASAPVTPVSVPGAPTRLIGQPTATTIAVIFAEPDPGGLPITGHDVSSDGGATWQPLVAETLTGLTPGTTYELTVRAVNAAGAGPAAEPVSVTTRPAAVPAPTATAGVASATVSWSRASSRTVTGYVVYARPGPATCTTTSIGATSCVIGGTAGVGYTYTVVALGPGGDSEPSDASNLVTPSAPPVPSGPPTDAAPTLTTPNGQPAELVPSQKVTLLGTGFAAHSTARIVLYSDPVVLGTAVANNLGNLTKGITLPAGLTPGVHVLVVTGVDPDGETHQIRMTFTVKAPDRPGDLPTTGPDVTPLFVFGLGLVAAGLLLASRRRA